MKEDQQARARNEGDPPSMGAEETPMKEAMRKHGPAITLATVLLASYALVLTSISDLRADFRAEFARVDARFEQIDVRFERIDGRLYELNERVGRIEGHLALTRASAADTSAAPPPAAEQASP